MQKYEEERVRKWVIKRLKEFCEKIIGGEFDTEGNAYLCIKETDNIGRLEDYFDELHSLISDVRKVLDKPFQVNFFNKLLGGWEEEAIVMYNPEDDEYLLQIFVTGEPIPPENIEDVKDKQIVDEYYINDWYGRGYSYIDQNPATDEFAGCSVARVWIPWKDVRSKVVAPELKEAFEKLFKHAKELIEEAEEKLIIPREEE